MVFTKTRNDLKRPEMTYNEQETTWNDAQRVRHNLEQPTQNNQQQADFEIILQYKAIGFNPTFSCNCSSIASQRMIKIERQTFYHVY